jgi:transposase-like protein
MSSNLFLNFRDEQSAYRFVEARVWSDGPKCPHCRGSQRIGKLRGRSTQIGTYKCYHCRKLFTVKAGTIFESSHVPLHKWLQATYLCGCGTEPIEPQRLSEALNVTYKTSAFIISRLRTAAIQSGVMGAASSCDPYRTAPIHDPPGFRDVASQSNRRRTRRAHVNGLSPGTKS